MKKHVISQYDHLRKKMIIINLNDDNMSVYIQNLGIMDNDLGAIGIAWDSHSTSVISVIFEFYNEYY